MGRLSGFGAALCAAAFSSGEAEGTPSSPLASWPQEISDNLQQTDSVVKTDSSDILHSTPFSAALNTDGFYQWCNRYMAPFRRLEYHYYHSNNFEYLRRYRIAVFQPLGKYISFGPYYTHLRFYGLHYFQDQTVHPAPCMGFSISIDLGFQRKKKPFIPLSPEELPYFDPIISPRRIPLPGPELVSVQN